MVFPALLLLLAVYIGAFWAIARRPDSDRRRLTHALVAALLSSGTAGLWATWVAPLLPSRGTALLAAGRGPASVEALAGMTVLFFLLTIGPNLVSLALLSRWLAARPALQRLVQRGGFVPLGVLYGLWVLVATLGPLLPLAIVAPGVLLDIVGASFFYAPATLSGLTAIVTLTLLDSVASRPRGAA